MKQASRLPEAVRAEAESILAITDSFCDQHLDSEYQDLCGKLVACLARKRPSPLARGEVGIWAGAVIYVVGRQNYLFDPSQRPHVTAETLSEKVGVSKSTLANKAGLIRKILGITPLTLDYSRREMIEQNPLAWMISVNGFLVDARTAPPHVQDELRRRGLIPDLGSPLSSP